MNEVEDTRRICRPLLIVGVCLSLIAWLVPVFFVLPRKVEAVESGDFYIWLVAWPAVYAMVVGFSLVCRRALDSKLTASFFGRSSGPAPRWIHLTMQTILFTGPPISIIGSMISVVMGSSQVRML